jgi:hypothetical protein
MKILFLSFYYNPDLSAGSFRAQSFIDELLKTSTNEIDLITTMPNRYSSFNVDAKSFEKIGKLNLYRVSLPNHKSGVIDQAFAYLYFAFAALKITRAKKYSVVVATSSRLMTAFLGALLAFSKSSFLYLDIRDIFVDTIDNIMSKKITFFATPLFKIIESFTFSRANHINLVSRGFESYFKNKFPTKSYTYFTNGIDDTFLDILPSKSQINSTEILEVLYAGNIGEGQGLHIIIPKLLTLFKGKIKFKIIGDGGRKKQLIEAVENHPYVNMIEFVSPMNRESLKKAYVSADILFLHLNDYEAFKKVLPSKLFEYAVTGKPIWAGLSGYSKEFTQSEISNSAVFNPCDGEEAMRTFQTLELKDNPREEFKIKYTRKNIMEKLVQDFYLRVNK